MEEYRAPLPSFPTPNTTPLSSPTPFLLFCVPLPGRPNLRVNKKERDRERARRVRVLCWKVVGQSG